MKTNKEANKEQTLTPREAAKNFIRPYLDKGDTISLHPVFKPCIETEDYSVHIDNRDLVVVTKLYGTEMNESFLITEIMQELVQEIAHKFIEKPINSSAKDEYKKREQEINALLVKLKAKLKKHKADFSKHPKNWGHVGDLGHIAEVLNEIA